MMKARGEALEPRHTGINERLLSATGNDSRCVRRLPKRNDANPIDPRRAPRTRPAPLRALAPRGFLPAPRPALSMEAIAPFMLTDSTMCKCRRSRLSAIVKAITPPLPRCGSQPPRVSRGKDIAGEGKKRHRLCQKFLAKLPSMPAIATQRVFQQPV